MYRITKINISVSCPVLKGQFSPNLKILSRSWCEVLIFAAVCFQYKMMNVEHKKTPQKQCFLAANVTPLFKIIHRPRCFMVELLSFCINAQKDESKR